MEFPILSRLKSCEWYARYIDDVCACMDKTDAVKFIEEFNNICPDIKFEAVTLDKSGIFLDLEINLRRVTESVSAIGYKLYTKPINKFLYISPLSSHAEHVHTSWIQAEVKRIKARCSDPIDADTYILEFEKRLRARGHEVRLQTSNPNPIPIVNPNNSQYPTPINRLNPTNSTPNVVNDLHVAQSSSNGDPSVVLNPNPFDICLNPNLNQQQHPSLSSSSTAIPIAHARYDKICRLIINEPNCHPKIKWSNVLRLPRLIHDIFVWEHDRQGIQVVIKNDKSIGRIVTRSRFKL